MLRIYQEKDVKDAIEKVQRRMKHKTGIHHRRVAWSEEDQTYIGRCPDLFHGGTHGDDPLKVTTELQQVIEEWERILDASQRPLPPFRVKPIVELA